MKITFLPIAGVLSLTLSVPAQSSWLPELPPGAARTEYSQADGSSGVRLMAQASVNRGEKIAQSPAASPLKAAHTNAAALALSTNGEINTSFTTLAGYPLKLSDELENNPTNGAWADAQINAMIPTNVMALNHQRVSVEGFMLPLRFEKGKVISFMLSANPPACCYATMPLLHEWVEVHVKPPGVEALDYSVVRARGILSVGAKRENGTLTSLYRLDADTVTEPR